MQLFLTKQLNLKCDLKNMWQRDFLYFAIQAVFLIDCVIFSVF